MLNLAQCNSVRAEVVDRRTYRRWNQAAGAVETNHAMISRIIRHHSRLGLRDEHESAHLRYLHLHNQASVAGRTRWLGGTDTSARRPACQFNCAYAHAATVYDIVDIFWLLLLGTGVGFTPKPGTLRGFTNRVYLTTKPSLHSGSHRGAPDNSTHIDDATSSVTITIGDSAEAWAKAVGKLFMLPPDIRNLTLDFSNVRGSGERLKGFGWICNGSKPLLHAMTKIVEILNRKQGCLLDEIDIIDVVNHLGTVLSTRRSAQLALVSEHSPLVNQFASMKHNLMAAPHRMQSNNSILLWDSGYRPDLLQGKIFNWLMQADAAGGMDPGIVNGVGALRRAPWFEGLNPCAEILLANQGFCNLCEVNLAAFSRETFGELLAAVHTIARANYRQTCVNLEDGILSRQWHQRNDTLRLCGVSMTGIVQAPWLTDHDLRRLRDAAVHGAHSMADELNLPRAKAVTTVKPSGTLSKVFGCTEGIHSPIAPYIFNWISFSASDPLLGPLASSNFTIISHPSDSNAVLVKFPVHFPESTPGFSRVSSGSRSLIVNNESAASQLNRYLRWMHNYVDHNVSCTITYDTPDDLMTLSHMMADSWQDDFVACSFMRRPDYTKTPADYGVPYLPQEVTTAEDFNAYCSTLTAPSFKDIAEDGVFEIEAPDPECLSGACPAR